MAYEDLKNAIKQAIKQNGNQEITGSILQNTLLSMADEFIQRDSNKYIFVSYLNLTDSFESVINNTKSNDLKKPLFITRQDGDYLPMFLKFSKIKTINGNDKNAYDSLFLKGPQYIYSDNNCENMYIAQVSEKKDISYIDNTCQLLQMPLRFIINTFTKTFRIECTIKRKVSGTISLNFHFLEHVFDRPDIYRIGSFDLKNTEKEIPFETDSIPDTGYYWHLIGIYNADNYYEFKVVGPYSKYLRKRNYFILATWTNGANVENNMINIQSPFIDVRDNIYFTYKYNKTYFEFPMSKSEKIDYAESLYLSAIMKSFLICCPGNIKIHFGGKITKILKSEKTLNRELLDSEIYITVGDDKSRYSYMIPFYPSNTYHDGDPLRNRVFDSYVGLRELSNKKKVTISFPKSLDANSIFDDDAEDINLIDINATVGSKAQYWIFGYDLILKDYFLFCYAYIPKVFFEHLRQHRIILFGCGDLSSHLFNMFTAYDYDEDSVEKKQYKSFSVLGDSYSTFKGYMTKNEAALWYPAIPNSGTEGANSGNGLSDVKQTWWAIFAKKTGIPLEENNSWSGACICYDSYGSGITDGKEKSFLSRCQNVGKPGLYLIFGGTNDSWAGVGMGDYKYSDWVEDDYSYYRPALAKMIDIIQNKYFGTTIVFILNDKLSSNINESTKTICEHYGVKVLSLQNISKIGQHPDSQGMEQIADQLIKFLNLN